ncbi:MAG: TldD/PmbA family protein [Deltaproteobacteria bacterium]|nr:TldD/PmbA family protein [Deltaproteobacteria bacterium]
MGHGDLALAVDEAVRAGAAYVDARHVADEAERIVARNGQVERVSHDTSEGVGVRALVDGAWGFGCAPGLDPAAIAGAARTAVGIARAAATLRRAPVSLAETPPAHGDYRTPCVIDPFTVPTAQKCDLAVRASEAAHQSPLVRSSEVFLSARRQWKRFVSSEGANATHDLVVTAAGLNVVVAEGDEVESRSYPFEAVGSYRAAGYEFIEGLDLVSAAPRVVDEAIEILRAPDCPAGRTTLIVGSAQLALQIHESCGHAVELDRVLGTEVSLAGTSFIRPDDLGRLAYGSDKVSIVADATCEGGLGTFAFDDDGVAATRTPIVERGKLVGFLTSRETAAQLGLDARGVIGGTMRAESWNRFPLIRMVNVNLESGEGSLEDLIRDTDDGMFVDGFRSWSIDDRRLNFHFACQVAWEVKNGRLTRRLRNPVYTGVTPEFWRSCDAVAGASEWRLWGLAQCGKGDPAQLVGVGHGAAPARFRNVEVGSGHRGGRS